MMMGIAVLVVVLLAGCAMDTNPGGLDPEPQETFNSATVSGNVQNSFDEDLAGVTITFYLNALRKYQTTTDGDGDYSVTVYDKGSYKVRASLGGYEEQDQTVSITSDGSYKTADFELEPESMEAGGIMASRAVSISGATIEFELDVFVVGSDGDFLDNLDASSFVIEDANFTVNRANSATDPDNRRDSAGGKNDRQAQYPGNIAGVDSPQDTVYYDFTQISVGGYTSPSYGSYSALLLFDQSGSITSTDPDDSRIEAAKYFLNALGSGDNVMVAAFSKGGNLPYEPITYYGESFTNDGLRYFSTLNGFKDTEGGNTPLFQATYTMVDFTYSHAPNSNRAVVVFTDGEDTEGGRTIEEIVNLAQSLNVKVFTVGLSDNVNKKVLAEMAVGTGGALMWARDARQLISTYKTLGNLLHGGAAYYGTRWRVQRSSGAFEGATGWFSTHMKVELDNGTLYIPIYVEY